MDARTRKLAGLAMIAVGIVLAVVGGLADQIGIGANDDGEIGGKQIAALVVGLVLIAGGIVVATVLAKDAGDSAVASGGAAGAAATGSGDTTGSGTDDTGTDTAESSAEAAPEPVEATDSSD